MTSSDSGEDFESADEDFDSFSELKTGEKSSNVISKRAVETKHVASSEIVLEKVDLKDLKLDSPLTKHIKYDLVKTSSLNKDSCDENISKSSRKIETKFAEKLEFKYSFLEKSQENQEDIPDNDGLKELSKFVMKVDNNKIEATTNSITVKETKKEDYLVDKQSLDITKLESGWEIEKENEFGVELMDNNKSETTSSIAGTNETKNCGYLVDNKTVDISKSGDGWEVEEEDGFEIPISLAKLSDGGIQCTQEQMCELDRVEFSPPREQEAAGWSGWGGWGVGSLISTATGSVSTFSSQVTAGLSTVMETTVGAPDAEALAAAIVQHPLEHITEDSANKEDKTSAGYGGFGSLVSGVSFLGHTVITRGLDTLETLGKKTMEVLQEGDPGLMKKRAMLFPNQDKPVLSQILREAKEKADHSDKEKEEKETARKAHFESLFDDFQGMVHLEALEMLSTQCELKLQSLLLGQSGPQLLDLQDTLSQVRDLCELTDDEEETEVLTPQQFAEQVTKCVHNIKVNITATKIIQINSEVVSRLAKLDTETATSVNQTAISSLAEFTAACIECFHKSAELLLTKPLRNTPDEAENYVELTSHLCARVSVIANEFTHLLTKHSPIANSSLITNIFLEASNSCSYIRNACQLLVPILQVGAVSS